VIEHFTNEIKYKWQFEKFCDDNPKTAEEFKRTVQKMIAFEESTHERFPHSPQDNRGYDPRGNQGGQSSRKRGPDNTLASMDKSKKSNKNNKKFEDLKNLSRPSIKVPSTRRASAGNSKSWVGTARTREKAKARTTMTRMVTATLT
jgi:hypothetical protein